MPLAMQNVYLVPQTLHLILGEPVVLVTKVSTNHLMWQFVKVLIMIASLCS